jgi:hypothetical protein
MVAAGRCQIVARQGQGLDTLYVLREDHARSEARANASLISNTSPKADLPQPK